MNERDPSQPTTTSPIDWEYTCTNCRRGFNASMAHQIVLINETEAELMCSWCTDTAVYRPPEDVEIERPTPIIDHTILTDEENLTTERIFFKGGAWLQYRETPEGRVCKEVFTEEGEEIDSSNAEIEYDGVDRAALYDSPETYCYRTIEQYEKYTVRGLQIQQPYLSAVVPDGN